MPATLALLLWLILLVALLYFDPAKDPPTSLALWVPVIWMFIVASRLPSQWLGVQVASAAEALQEGNVVDRSILSFLILLAIGVLLTRSFKWKTFITANSALVALFLFALISVFWSDFPLISLKRWFRDLGDYFVVLVVLSDPRPLEAVRTVLRRTFYLLIPLSVLMVKYFPQISKEYDPWSGASMYVGASTSKNMLGVACLVSGIFFFWDTLTRWSDRREPRVKRVILVNFVFLVMTLWLLRLAESATSTVCLVIGCVLLAALHSKWGRRQTALIKVLAPATFCIYLTLAFGFNMNGYLAHEVGRNSNLTDRTALWAILLDMHTNPFVGTGYASFWLGPRLEHVWRLFGHVNEAHNGYLGVYLELGLVGLAMLLAFLLASYRTICKRLTPFSSLGSLGLSLWTVLLFYNVTEAAFKTSLIWITFLLVGITASPPVREPARDAVTFGDHRVAETLPTARFARRSLQR
jgi:exopolysaccharide production protein ExoQ